MPVLLKFYSSKKKPFDSDIHKVTEQLLSQILVCKHNLRAPASMQSSHQESLFGLVVPKCFQI